MTNYNERLDELLTELRSGTINFDNEAKQAILRLVVQILEEAKEQLPTSEQLTTKYGYHMPEKMYGYKLGLHDAREAIDQFEQNLLKVLEEL